MPPFPGSARSRAAVPASFADWVAGRAGVPAGPERDGLVPGPARAPNTRRLSTVCAAVRHARADVRVLHGFVGRAAH